MGKNEVRKERRAAQRRGAIITEWKENLGQSKDKMVGGKAGHSIMAR